MAAKYRHARILGHCRASRARWDGGGRKRR
uniref:Uncharacterized protein n=1 Tax=Arundo donax TaxID=35708 RepID=A0A0A9BA31_ARUDO